MQGSSNFRMIVRRGPQPNQVYELNKDSVTLGRDITNDIVINDPEVSRHHCRFIQSGDGYTIEDLGSTNGTFINGQRMTGSRPLSHNDMLGLGETVTLAYEGLGAAASGVGATMVSGAPSPGEPVAAPGFGPLVPVAGVSPPSEPYPMPGVPAQQPYGAPQPPGAYDYDYQEEFYEESGTGRWVVMGCGCFLVVCIVVSVIGGIVVDAKCWWDDIPVVSETFNWTVKDTANCR